MGWLDRASRPRLEDEIDIDVDAGGYDSSTGSLREVPEVRTRSPILPLKVLEDLLRGRIRAGIGEKPASGKAVVDNHPFTTATLQSVRGLLGNSAARFSAQRLR